MPRRDFHFAGHALRVEAAEEPLAWLHEFIAPQFAARDTDAPDRTIALIIDAREHARLVAHGPHPERLTRACFTLDSGILNGRVWNVPGGEVVLDGEREVFYRRRPGEASVVEVIAARDDADTRVALMRAVRESAMLYATRAGWLMLHAAAVCVGSDAFVIAGPKRAGKTSLLLHALRNEQGAYVANDRVALGAEPSGVRAHGIPTIAIIRKESTVWFAGLDAQLEGARYHFRHRAAEKTAPEGALARPAATWPLGPAQLCHLLGVESRASARRDGRPVSPRRDVTGWHGVRRAEHQAGAGCLARSRVPLMPGGRHVRQRPDHRGVTRRKRGPVRCARAELSCRLGPDAYGDGAHWLSSLGQDLASRAARASRSIRA